jgi:hypothetical protein
MRIFMGFPRLCWTKPRHPNVLHGAVFRGTIKKPRELCSQSGLHFEAGLRGRVGRDAGFTYGRAFAGGAAVVGRVADSTTQFDGSKKKPRRDEGDTGASWTGE